MLIFGIISIIFTMSRIPVLYLPPFPFLKNSPPSNFYCAMLFSSLSRQQSYFAFLVSVFNKCYVVTSEDLVWGTLQWDWTCDIYSQGLGYLTQYDFFFLVLFIYLKFHDFIFYFLWTVFFYFFSFLIRYFLYLHLKCYPLS